MGLGFGYATNPLNLESNNQNVAISSPISFSVHLKLNYNRPNVYKNIGFHSGLFFTHYSNSSVRVPNFGINSVFINAGFSYRFKKTEILYPKREKAGEIGKTPIHIGLGFAFSAHEIQATLGVKPVFVFSAYADKKISAKNGIKAGVDFFDSMAYKDYAEFFYKINTENPDRTLEDHKQIGVFAGHNLYFNKWVFETLVGYYLYNPLKKTPSLYQNIGFTYHFDNSRFSTGFKIKVHNFRADYTSLGVQYQVF